MKSLIFIRDIFRKYSLLLLLSTVLVIFVSIIEATSLFTIGPLIDLSVDPTLQNASPLTNRIVSIMAGLGVPLRFNTYLTLFAVLIILSSTLRILFRYCLVRMRFIVVRDLTIGTFSDFLNSKWHFFNSSKQGTLLNTFTREIENVGDAFSAMANFFASFLQLTFYLIIPFYLSWRVTLISFATVFLLSLPFALVGKISYRLGSISTTARNKLSLVLNENFTLTKIVIGFANQKKAVKDLLSSFDVYRRAATKSQTISFAIPILYRPLGVAVLVIALFSARYFKVPISEIAVILLALLQLVIVVGNIVKYKNNLDNASPSYEQIKELKDKAVRLRQKDGSRKFEGFKKFISLEKISFAYPDRQIVLKNINMKIPKGKMVAIVGGSGTGKSTLIDLIMNFNDPTEGQVRFDGIDLKDFDISSYRKRIGYVPQDSVLFNMSIKNNLLWAKDDTTDEEIKHACFQANAVEFIESFPHGYDTIVGDRGVRLSGGQCQRIALARAILRKPDVLILDEATSSLDTHSERLIQQAVENIARETTVIIIAHRLSTIANADYMYVLKDGKIVEEGTHEDLVKMKGHFAHMARLQLLKSTK